MKDTRLVVRKQLTIERSVEDGFRLFTTDIAAWWPLDRGHSIFGERSKHPVLEPKVGGRVYEISNDGDEAEWGSVVDIEPPHRLTIRWHPGSDPAQATEFTVTFAATESGTRLQLEHTGWEQFGDEAAARYESYDHGWDVVLGEYRSVR